MKGKPGADSSIIVTNLIGGKTLIDVATEHFGRTPLFWGRYFKNLNQQSSAEYRHRKEGAILRRNNIRVLPTAQQTNKVGRDKAIGIVDAQGNVEDLLSSFGKDYLATLGREFLLFLDVEPTHPLSVEYYQGWSQAVLDHSSSLSDGRYVVRPALYLNRNDNPTWNSVIKACKQGSECNGFWVANYGSRPGCSSLVDWKKSDVQPDRVLPCDVLIWQYAEECSGGNGFDCNETNPAIDTDALMQKLILPPEIT
jgi:hypothetical protein